MTNHFIKYRLEFTVEKSLPLNHNIPSVNHMQFWDLIRRYVFNICLLVLAPPILAQSPVLTQGGLTEKVLNKTGSVNVVVIDGQGFGENQHGHRITATFQANTEIARLVQLTGSATYRYDNWDVSGINATGIIHQSLNIGSGIFWTSTDSSPAYSTRTASRWNTDGARPFHKTAIAAAKWLATQDILFISSLENPTVISAEDRRYIYCDDYPHIHRTNYWIPFCGSTDDYIAYSGVAIDRTIFVGAIRSDKVAASGVRAGGKFDENAIYVVSPGGSTSHATPVLAAYASNLAFNNPTWGAVKLKQELFALAKTETIRHSDGGTRKVSVIRPANAPTAVAPTAPEAPTSLSATASGRNIINLSWTAPSNNGGVAISGYKIEVSDNGTSDWTVLVENTASKSTTYAHENLMPETTRYYRVSAINSVGPGASSNIASATTDPPTAPDAPTSLTATASGRTIINLSWTAPSDDGGADISGYRIEVSPNGSSKWMDVVANTDSKIRMYAHENLEPDTTLHYRVSAINSVGTGSASSTSSATTDARTAPDAPASLIAVASGRTIINLVWTPPSDNGGSIITGYRIEASGNGTSFWMDLKSNTGSNSTTYAHENLPPGTIQFYRVSAINSIDTGVSSNIASATTDAPTAPDAPTSLTANASGRTIINLSWKAPSNNGGAIISGYKIEVSPDGSSGWTDLESNTKSTSTTYAHENLEPETTHHYQVSAVNSVGSGTPSNIDTATTDAVSTPDAPTDLIATASGPTVINLSWKAPANNGGAVISGYKIEVSPNGTSNWRDLVANTASKATTYAHENLKPETTRHYRVSAINSVDTGIPSTVALGTTDAVTVTFPDAPTSLTAAPSGRTIINLSWKAPTNNGGSAISGYRIEVSPDGSSGWTDLESNTKSTSTTYAHENLEPETTHHYQVSAINSVGGGPPSNIDTATTDAVSTPDAPTDLIAIASGPTVINLSWKAPANNGGSAISGYRIEISLNGNSNWTDLVTNTRSRSTTYVHRNRTPETTGYYRISAINSLGTGPVSSIKSASTEALTVPDAPTGLSATASGRAIIYLSWTAPTQTGGAAIIGYKIEVSSNAGSAWADLVLNTGSSVTVYAHTGLVASATRHYRISAINSVGTGVSSNVSSATTDGLTVPDPPTAFTAVASGQTTINLSWGAPSNDGGAVISGYKIEVSSNGESGWADLVSNTGSTTTTYAHTGLAPSTTRYYRISAINTVGTGEPSTIASVTTDAQTVGPPNAPAMLTATALGQSAILLSWSVPSNNGGSVVSGYKIEVSPDGTSNWTDLVPNTGSRSTTYTHEDLAPETTRYYRISAINSVGTGPASLIVSATSGTELTFSIEGGIPHQHYPVGVDMMDFMLPTAVGGVAPYIYALSPSVLPEGLSFDEATRTISGTPSLVTAAQTFIWGVADAVGNESSLEFTIEVYEIYFKEGIENKSYPRDQPIEPLQLPEIIGGLDPIQYTLTLLDLPANLRFDLPTRTISGTPHEITPPVEMIYRVQDAHGAKDSLIFTIEVVSPVNRDEQAPSSEDFIVHYNYPNPFTHSTSLVFDLPWSARVQLEVLDMTGRRVYTMSEVILTSGKGQNIKLNDLSLPSGAYLYRMIATSFEGVSSVYVGHFMTIQ